MAHQDLEEKRRKRRERYERELERQASDPAYAAERRQKALEAERRYRAKSPSKPRPAKSQAPVAFERKPGRIVALCGWHRW